MPTLNTEFMRVMSIAAQSDCTLTEGELLDIAKVLKQVYKTAPVIPAIELIINKGITHVRKENI